MHKSVVSISELNRTVRFLILTILHYFKELIWTTYLTTCCVWLASFKCLFQNRFANVKQKFDVLKLLREKI